MVQGFLVQGLGFRVPGSEFRVQGSGGNHHPLAVVVVHHQHLSRSGPVTPKAGYSLPRRADQSRGGPVYPEAGLSVPRRACMSRGGPISPETGLSVPRRANQFRGGPLRHSGFGVVITLVTSSTTLTSSHGGLRKLLSQSSLNFRGGDFSIAPNKARTLIAWRYVI